MRIAEGFNKILLYTVLYTVSIAAQTAIELEFIQLSSRPLVQKLLLIAGVHLVFFLSHLRFSSYAFTCIGTGIIVTLFRLRSTEMTYLAISLILGLPYNIALSFVVGGIVRVARVKE